MTQERPESFRGGGSPVPCEDMQIEPCRTDSQGQ